MSRHTWTKAGGGLLYAGHTGFSDYLFCDGHVKTLRPLQTLDTASGGAGTTNMWDIANATWTGVSATNAAAAPARVANTYK